MKKVKDMSAAEVKRATEREERNRRYRASQRKGVSYHRFRKAIIALGKEAGRVIATERPLGDINYASDLPRIPGPVILEWDVGGKRVFVIEGDGWVGFAALMLRDFKTLYWKLVYSLPIPKMWKRALPDIALGLNHGMDAAMVANGWARFESHMRDWEALTKTAKRRGVTFYPGLPDENGIMSYQIEFRGHGSSVDLQELLDSPAIKALKNKSVDPESQNS